MGNSGLFLVNPSEPLRTVNADQELLNSLERITTRNPPVHTCSTVWTYHGFYNGPTSIAYLFYRLFQIFPDLEFKQQSLFEWAESYLTLGARLKKKAPNPTHCGIANETLAHKALTAVMQQDTSLARQICSFEPVVNAESKEESNEWLYGRAGYLYILRLCRTLTDKEDPTSGTAALINATIEKTVDRLVAAPQPWTWHGKPYLGATHGTVGIIYQLMLSRPSVAPQLQPVLRDLLDMQQPSGNFPSSVSSKTPDRLVQFCHGSPGFALSFAALAPLWPDLQPRIEEAVSAAKEDTWRRGLLTKAPCLCHGIAGNALVFGGGDEEEQARFNHFLAFMSTSEMERAGWLRETGSKDEFGGLYTGEAGRAWVWAQAVAAATATGGRSKTCIGYNDI